jgi:GNAT superfamily N-acetyltransferase
MTTIRPASVDDAAEVTAVHEEAWDAALGELIGERLDRLAPRADRVERMRQGLENLPPDAAVLVAERDGAIVGMGVVRHPAGEPGEVRDLYVSPAAWGSGVASALLSSTLDWLWDRGASSAGLWVVADNVRARRFYEREGWAPDGQERATELGPPEVHYRRKGGRPT